MLNVNIVLYFYFILFLVISYNTCSQNLFLSFEEVVEDLTPAGRLSFLAKMTHCFNLLGPNYDLSCSPCSYPTYVKAEQSLYFLHLTY